MAEWERLDGGAIKKPFEYASRRRRSRTAVGHRLGTATAAPIRCSAPPGEDSADKTDADRPGARPRGRTLPPDSRHGTPWPIGAPDILLGPR